MKTTLLVLATLAVASPVIAGPRGSTSQSKPHSSSAPSSSKLPRANGVSTSVVSPFAWVDDASVLSPGSGALTVAAANWHGTDASETDAPIVSAAAGLAPRFQLSARVPYVVGDNTAGVIGGWGTTYLTGKFAVINQDGDGFKLALSPTLQLLGTSVTLPSTESRAHWGIPVSAEVDQGVAHAFASAGYFSGGIGFVGAGVGIVVSPRVSVSGSLSHAWSTDSTTNGLTIAGSNRTEIAGGAALTLTSHVAVFGSLAQTIATTDANGAGMTFVGGVLFVAERGGSRH